MSFPREAQSLVERDYSAKSGFARWSSFDTIDTIRNMKTVIAIACILSAVFVQADIIDIYLQSCTDLFMACAKENGYTEQDPREIYDKDNNLGVDGCTCLRTCTMKALGMLNGLNLELGGMYAFINAVHAGNPEKINFLQNVVVDCKDQVKSMTDECKLGFSFTDCFLSKH